MALYSVKMRASENGRHISGAEGIVSDWQAHRCIDQMLRRGWGHPKGRPDLLNVKVEQVREEEILYLDALPVCTVEVKDADEGREEIRKFLASLSLGNAEGVMKLLSETYAMRGAMLLDVDTLTRLEPDKERGIRATYMDGRRDGRAILSGGKDPYQEAVVLATKVANAPNVIGEICISDDPGYVTGYVASKALGYRRVTKVKEPGSEHGGRIFLYRGGKEDVGQTIAYLEKQPVIVRNVRPLGPKEKAQGKWGFVEEGLRRLKEENLERGMKAIQTPQSSVIRCRDRELLMLASNNYLEMSCREEVKQYAAQALLTYGTGSGGSRLTSGNLELHEALEQKIASFKEAESALALNTGYVANLAVISALMGKGDVIFSDELNHASIIDGCRLSGAQVVVYRHNDMEDLERKVRTFPCRKGLAVSDAVFSMDGDILRLPEFVRIADRHGLISMVDEAHSTGVIGRTGRGVVEHYKGVCRPDICMGTLSKAIGSEGGFVCGSARLIEYIRQKARGFIFSTSLSPAALASSIKALEVLLSHPELVVSLRENVSFFCQCLREGGYAASSETAIVPILIGDEKKALEASEALFEEGYFISAIRYPTVSRGSARLRAALMATHTKEQLKRAAEAILRIGRQKGAFL